MAAPSARDLADRLTNEGLLRLRQWAVEQAVEMAHDADDALDIASMLLHFVLSGPTAAPKECEQIAGQLASVLSPAERDAIAAQYTDPGIVGRAIALEQKRRWLSKYSDLPTATVNRLPPDFIETEFEERAAQIRKVSP